jgi:hypothetical protein
VLVGALCILETCRSPHKTPTFQHHSRARRNIDSGRQTAAHALHDAPVLERVGGSEV